MKFRRYDMRYQTGEQASWRMKDGCMQGDEEYKDEIPEIKNARKCQAAVDSK
jgi:hypothetical protein